jgi:PAS domain S-box-containing protein
MRQPVGTPVSVPSPIRLALTVLAIVFLAEAVVMSILLGRQPVLTSLADASVLIVFIAPVLWWRVVRPLRSAAAAQVQAATVVACAGDAIITIDERGRVEGLNLAAERLFGSQAAEVVGGPVTRLMPERYRDAHEAGLAQLRSGGEPRLIGKTVELHGLRADGSEFPLELSLSRWEAGGGTFYTGIVRDITERNRVEEQLRLHSTALESAVNAVLITDRDGHIAWVNSAFTRLTGYTAEEVLGQNPRLLKSGQHTQEFYRVLWETILAGQMWRGETINRRKDGSVFTEEQTITPVRDARGEITHFISIKHDITEGKRAQETLHALYRASLQIQERLDRKERLDRLIQVTRELLQLDRVNVLLADPSGQWLQALASSETGEPLESIRVPIRSEGGAIAQAYLTQQTVVWDGAGPVPEAFRLMPPYDRIAALRSRVFAIVPLVVQGRAIGVLGVDRKSVRKPIQPATVELLQLFAAQAAIAIETARLHEEALTQKARLTQIFDSTSDGIILVGPMGRIESANRRAGELLGFNPETIVGVGLANLVTGHFRAGGDHRQVLTAFRSALLGDQDGEKEGDLALPSTRMVLHWVARPTKDALGAPTGLTLTFQDVTREREAEQMKSDFVSFATHQLRTPLAGIKWMLELAGQEPGVPQDAGSFIQDARASAERLIRLVNDLLDASRLERGKLTIVSQTLDLASLTQSVLDEVALLIKEKGHLLSVAGADQVSPVLADPQLIRQVILNLASNAIKYTLPGGHIAIRMTPDGDMVRWGIQDSGVGIPPEAQHRLFEKFYRAENVLTIETEGTGLGLYLVRLIVERLGGRVWCESEEGKGATFFFTLPRAVG